MPLDLNKPVPQAIVDEVIAFSDKLKVEALAAGKYQGFPFRYEGEFRNYGPMLVTIQHKPLNQRILTNRCPLAGMGPQEVRWPGSLRVAVPCLQGMGALPRRLAQVHRLRRHSSPRGLRGSLVR
jgi:hypothetical protein